MAKGAVNVELYDVAVFRNIEGDFLFGLLQAVFIFGLDRLVNRDLNFF